MTHAFTRESVFASIRKGATLPPLDEAVEAELVRQAQAGSEGATYRLIAHYAPAIRNALARFGETIDREDAEQEVFLAFLSLVKVHDPATGRIAGRVHEYLVEGLHEAAAKSNAWSIPARTAKRFFAILKLADGSLREGLRIAPDHAMDPATFLAVARALRNTGSIEGLNEAAELDGSFGADHGVILGSTPVDAFAAVEDAALVADLLSLLDEQESRITRFAYGFDALPNLDADQAKEGVARSREEGVAVANDSVVARHVGLSRQKTQRTRAAALAKMRAHLGLDA